jgi:hypothetical protein
MPANTLKANNTGSVADPADLTVAQTKTLLALSNVDNTTDAAKPVSTAQQTALNLKANIASPAFTGIVTLPTGLTGVLRADTGVVGTDTDVTDIVAAASTAAAGKVELATTAEATAQTDTVRAVTPAGLADRVLTSRAVTTIEPLTGGGPLTSDLSLDISVFTDTVKGAVPAPTTPTGKFLKDDGNWAVPTVIDEVWVGSTAPTDSLVELWYNPTAVPDTNPAWTALTLVNGWSTTGTGSLTPRYRKIGDLVYLEGACRQTGLYVSGTVATLPGGYRPPAAKRYQLGAHKLGTGGNYLIRASIDTAGVIATSADYTATDKNDPLLYLDMIPPFSVTP